MSQKFNSFFHVFLGYLQSIFSDIQEVYRNFIHWNLSKVVISFVALFVGFILSLPFLIVIFTLMGFDSIDWITLVGGILSGKALGFEIISQFLTSPFIVLTELILIIFAFSIFIAGYNYTSFLSARLYLFYKEKKKLPIIRKDYFQKELIVKFLQIFFWQGIFVAIAFGVFVIFGIILFILSQFGVLSFNGLSLSLLISLGLCFTLGFYIAYRVYFAIFIFADSNDIKISAKQYIKDSLHLTKGKNIFIFLLFFIIFNLILSPIYFLGDTLSQAETEAKDYLNLKTSSQPLAQEDQIYYQYLQEKYTEKSDDQIMNSITLWNFVGIVFSFLLFLFIEGLLYVVSVWFYKEILLKGEKKHRGTLFSKWWKKGEL